MKRGIFFIYLLGIVCFLTSCGEKKDPLPLNLRTKPIATETIQTPKGADPSVSAEMGGAGFETLAKNLGWQTYEAESESSPNAKKGGRVAIRYTEFPASLRPIGKDSNYDVTSMLLNLAYEGLLSYEYKTGKFTSYLATHWWISDDGKTFRYRINPDARWSDGTPVTSEDVLATWQLQVDEGILEPYSNILYAKYTEPKIISKYIVETSITEDNWKLFLYFSTMVILPSHYIGGLSGADYLETFQFDMPPGSGPYILNKEKMIKGKTLTMVRRTDWWGHLNPNNKGVFNFDEVKIVIVQDDRLTLEKFKKGELDLYFVYRAQWWVEELDPTQPEFDYLYRGLIQKKKIFNYRWKGISGLAFNMRRAPFNDINLRKAFAKLWNINLLRDKLFFNEYDQLKSYFPGGVYENQSNPIVAYDPKGAVALLKASGWINRTKDGWLEKDGSIFELDMGIEQSLERIFTPYQEDLAKVGIKLNLNYVTGQTTFKNVMNERNFDIHYQFLRTGYFCFDSN